ADLPFFLRDRFSKPMDAILEELFGLYQTTFPDVVVLLDPGLDVAVDRISERAGDAEKELHETSDSLRQLSQSYAGVIKELKTRRPDIASFVVNTGGGDVDDSLKAIIESINLAETGLHLNGG
ncbi:MAG: hypothetical protein AAF492_18400, partial [Verrucomicrobiota bacterium]